MENFSEWKIASTASSRASSLSLKPRRSAAKNRSGGNESGRNSSFGAWKRRVFDAKKRNVSSG
jgi:hypothetical protein